MDELEKLLGRIEEESERGSRVSVESIMESLGLHAFGPALLVLGLAAVSPAGGIPGAPTVISVFIVLIAGQLLIGRSHFWLPSFLQRRSIDAALLNKSVRFARPPVRVVGKVIGPRLTFLATGTAAQVIGAICALLALTMPPLEIVPFAVAVPASAIAMFGLALLARDGIVAGIGVILSGVGIYLAGPVLIGFL